MCCATRAACVPATPSQSRRPRSPRRCATASCLQIVYASRSLPEPTERLIRPIEITSENGVLFLRAYCYLREDLRAFVIEKMTSIELTDRS